MGTIKTEEEQDALGTHEKAVSSHRTPKRDIPAELPAINLMGMRLHAVIEAQAIEHILAELSAGHGGWVVTPNLDHLRRFTLDRQVRELYATASLSLADGMPLIWAARLRGTPLPQRVPGSGLIWSLSAAAAAGGRSLYLLGGEPGSADDAAAILRSRYPNVRITGTDCPEMGFEQSESVMQSLIDRVVKADPDIVYVALGSPKQEWLIGRIYQHLPRAWWIGVGISFSFVAGRVRRAPAWMQRAGLEWLHRLAQEPRRLAKRYLVQGLPFAVRLLTWAMFSRPNRGDSVTRRCEGC
ncbi:MAG: WecB/TagA/CpsF family glycosyltransferase [Tepidisphaeraceae bacterium]|jgi:N-acetylglucosaminyldiphosphoundecaprenol N-acetyl-beta-D-mannosaminyltransferase